MTLTSRALADHARLRPAILIVTLLLRPCSSAKMRATNLPGISGNTRMRGLSIAAAVTLVVLLADSAWAQSEPARPLLNPETRLAFTRRVQPILFNCCGSLACHGRPDAPGLQLRVPVRFSQLTPSITEHNLDQVLPLINLDKPPESPLLQRAVQAHGGSSRPPLPGPGSAAYRTLETWVLELAGKNCPFQAETPGSSSETSAARPIHPAGSSPSTPPSNNIPTSTPPGQLPQVFPPGMTNPGPASLTTANPIAGMPTAGPGASPLPTANPRSSERPTLAGRLANLVLPGAIVGSSVPATATTHLANTSASSGYGAPAPYAMQLGQVSGPIPGSSHAPVTPTHNLPPNPFATGTVPPANRLPLALPPKPMPINRTSADPFDPNVFNQMMHSQRR